MSPVTSGFVNVAGIQSPGLTAAPAIAKMVENILLSHAEREGRPIAVNPEFNPIRKEKKPFRQLSREEQDVRIKENPAYGRVICRCEQITEGEILDAIDSPVVPGSVDAIKRRTRAGMGRCQGGFCQPRVLEILAHELGKEWTEINLKGEGTNILLSDNRGGVL
jgi:glycerol-3-phosphate dehydrogenase